jgi:hypothetical protein
MSQSYIFLLFLILIFTACQEDFIDETDPVRVSGSFSVSRLDTLSDTLTISAELIDNYRLGAYTITLLPLENQDASTLSPPLFTFIETFGIGGQKSTITKEIELLKEDVASGRYSLNFQYADERGLEENLFIDDTTIFLDVVSPTPQIRLNKIYTNDSAIVYFPAPRDTITIDSPYVMIFDGSVMASDTLDLFFARARTVKIGDSILTREPQLNRTDVSNIDSTFFNFEGFEFALNGSLNDSLDRILSLEVFARSKTIVDEEVQFEINRVFYFVRMKPKPSLAL